MSQRDLNRAVARATGETVECIEKMGFNLVVMPGPFEPLPIADESYEAEPVSAESEAEAQTV